MCRYLWVFGSLTLLVADPVQAGSSTGPDVVVSIIGNSSDAWRYYGVIGSTHAYAFATTSCNIGDTELLWYDHDNIGSPGSDQHPVIAQNLFRLKNGRLEQVGVSWLKHGFCAVNEFTCGACQQTSCDTLGLDCADTYTAGLNGSATWRGARSEVNATTGDFPYPSILTATGDAAIRGRLQVDNADISPALNAGARYFVEVTYIAKDDLAAGNGLNSVSWREINVPAVNSIGFAAPTVVGQPAIHAWKDADPTVEVQTNAAANDGTFYLAYKTSDLGGGMWRYEYAAYNYNSDRSGQGLFIPVGPGVQISNIGFKDIDHHSGEPYANTDWIATTTGCGIQWQTDDFATDPNANALRWGTMFNFWFDANAAPQAGMAELSLFAPGVEPFIGFSVMAPSSACSITDSDCDGDTDLVDFAQLQKCLPTGALPLGDACRVFDGDCNAILDLDDYAAFESALLGP